MRPVLNFCLICLFDCFVCFVCLICLFVCFVLFALFVLFVCCCCKLLRFPPPHQPNTHTRAPTPLPLSRLCAGHFSPLSGSRTRRVEGPRLGSVRANHRTVAGHQGHGSWPVPPQRSLNNHASLAERCVDSLSRGLMPSRYSFSFWLDSGGGWCLCFGTCRGGPLGPSCDATAATWRLGGGVMGGR